jgi:hypothetical protein
MKTEKPIKMSNKVSPTEVYYTYSHWPAKQIDGVDFLPVVKNIPSNATQSMHYMRKDSLQRIKD